MSMPKIVVNREPRFKPSPPNNCQVRSEPSPNPPTSAFAVKTGAFDNPAFKRRPTTGSTQVMPSRLVNRLSVTFVTQ